MSTIDEYRKVAQQAADLYYAIATHDDPMVCGHSGITRHSRELLLHALADAYPDVYELDVYDAWLDCNESIEYCVNLVRTNPSRTKGGSNALPGND